MRQASLSVIFLYYQGLQKSLSFIVLMCKYRGNVLKAKCLMVPQTSFLNVTINNLDHVFTFTLRGYIYRKLMLRNPYIST